MERRAFLAATLMTPFTQPGEKLIAEIVHQSPEQKSLDEKSPDKKSPAEKTDKRGIPTPALLLDLENFEYNLRVMADHCRASGRGFRPHTKTHKCPEIARRQIQAGAAGVCTATVSELEAMVTAGIRGVLLTSPVVDAGKIQRIVQLVKSGGDLIVAVGHAVEVDALNRFAHSAGVRVRVLIDIDVGDRRTGALPGEPALALARHIAGSEQLQLVGLQAYAGHASHTVGFEARQRVSREAMAKAVETKKLLAKSGFPVEILSGGSTGTYNIDSAIDGVTELQVGSYIFMDVDYRRIGGKESTIYNDFRPSLTVLTTVISANYPDRVTVDAGTKAIDTTTAHRPEAKSPPNLIYNRAGDEFGSITREGDGPLPKLGDRIEFIVPHCDPSVNLYDHIYVTRGEHVEYVWPVLARRENRG